MLAFVTSLRHPYNSHDYDAVEAMFQESLSSWIRQRAGEFFVVVVANRRPGFTLPRSVRFLQVEYPPPSEVRGPMTGIPAVLADKGTKLAVGLTAARELGPTHVMFVDADDFVSNRLARFVEVNRDEPGWVISSGWRYNTTRRAIRPHFGDFHRQCGSSHIVREDLYPSPSLPLDAEQDVVRRAFGESLDLLIGSHMHASELMPLTPLPFPGALYRVGSGESHSGNGMGGFGRPIAPELADEFGVAPTGRTPWRVARAVLPGREAVTARLRPLMRGV